MTCGELPSSFPPKEKRKGKKGRSFFVKKRKRNEFFLFFSSAASLSFFFFRPDYFFPLFFFPRRSFPSLFPFLFLPPQKKTMMHLHLVGRGAIAARPTSSRASIQNCQRPSVRAAAGSDAVRRFFFFFLCFSPSGSVLVLAARLRKKKQEFARQKESCRFPSFLTFRKQCTGNQVTSENPVIFDSTKTEKIACTRRDFPNSIDGKTTATTTTTTTTTEKKREEERRRPLFFAVVGGF